MQDSLLKTKGKFFVPEFPEQIRYGNLIIEGNSIVLESLGGLPDVELNKTGSRTVKQYGNKPEYTKVFGMTNEGSVTLVKKHFGRSSSWKFLEETKENFSMAFVGDEDLTKNPNLKFKEIILNVTRLKDFLSSSNLKLKMNFDKKKHLLGTELKSAFATEPFYEFKTTKYTISFIPSYSYAIYGNDDPLANEYPIKEFFSIRIKQNRGRFNIRDLLEIIYQVRNFIGFALHDSVYFTSMQVKNRNTSKLETNTNKNLTTNVYLHEKDLKKIDKSKGYSYLLQISDIKDNFEDIFTKWLSLKKSLPRLYNNYFSYLYSDKPFWDSTFLALVLGIESYIEKELKTGLLVKKGKSLKSINIKEIEDKLKEVTDGKISKFLLDKLQYYISDVSFIEKFSSIKTILPKSLSSKLSNEDITLIKQIRNKIAHSSVPESMYKKAKTRDVLLKLVKINEVCIMKYLGFEENLIDNALKRHQYI